MQINTAQIMNEPSRTTYATRNFIWTSVGNIVNYVLKFVLQTVFIQVLGTTYLGVNGLFTNVLGVLSLAEMGVSSAITFSLYKPVAEHDIKKIQALINFYKTAYRYIAAVVCTLGLILIPFLPYIVKQPKGVTHLTLIYLIFLANTVLSYLVTYKTSVFYADQKNYVITNITTAFLIIASLCQLPVLLISRNYILYLLTNIGIQFLGKIYAFYRTDKMYPYLKGKNHEKLKKEDRQTIITKIQALMVHKVGDVAINQTDNILTSSIINVTTVGLVSNFTLIVGTVNSFISTLFGSAIAGLGNLLATSSEKHKKDVFDDYDFACFWFYGWSAICLLFLLKPFVRVWLGEDKLIDNLTVFLLCLNYYMTGCRVSLGNIKSAAGVFEPDAWMPIAQSIVNIVTSIIFARMIGLPGIYIGTLLSALIPSFGRPYIVYHYIFHTKSIGYYIEYFKRFGILAISCAMIAGVSSLISIQNGWAVLLFRLFLCIIIPNIFIVILYKKTSQYQYCINLIQNIVKKVKEKLRWRKG